MMDSFDEKRGMMKKLLAMLKEHASSEVNSGLKKPEGEGDMHGLQVEKVEMLPDHGMDEATPEHDVLSHEMHDGGVVEDVNAEMPGEIPMESENGHPDIEGSAHKEAAEPEEKRETEGDIAPASLFARFLGKKKRK
jgi:hypothetical protein